MNGGFYQFVIYYFHKPINNNKDQVIKVSLSISQCK